MSESNDTKDQSRVSPLELAALVSQRVELRNVMLTQCGANRSPNIDLQQEGTELRYGISEVRFGRDPDANTLFVLPSFNLDVLHRSESGTDSVLSVSATFVLVYSLDSFEGISQRDLEAFSVTNGVFNAWPYWREFVQSTTSRMGMPGSITMPVYRIGDNPFHKHSTPLGSTSAGKSENGGEKAQEAN